MQKVLAANVNFVGNEADFKFERFEKVDFDSLSSRSLTRFKKAVTFSVPNCTLPETRNFLLLLRIRVINFLVPRKVYFQRLASFI